MNRPPARSASQRDRILALLRQCGPAGITNLELVKCCLRYGARIFELRRLGYTIDTRLVGDGVFKFVLVREPPTVKPLPLFAGARPPLPGNEEQAQPTQPLLFSEVR